MTKPGYTRSKNMDLHRVSLDQLVSMFDYFDKHPLLPRGINTGMGSQQKVDELWTDLAQILNKSKAKKAPHQWKKYWITLKCRIKKKAAGIRAGSGGALTPLERRVLSLLGNDMSMFESVNECKQEIESPNVYASTTTNTDDDFSWPSEEEVTIKAVSAIQTSHQSDEEHIGDDAYEVIVEEDRSGGSVRDQSERDSHYSSPRSESLKRPRRAFVRGRPGRTRSQITNSGFEPWLISLERRRVAAEEKMAVAMKTMADAALLNAQTLRMCAQAGIHLRTSNGHTNNE